MTQTFDTRPCELGEGPLWHPVRHQLYWFDIIGKRLMTRQGNTVQEWQFDEHVSAAGWVDETTLILASESGLWRFDLITGARVLLVPLEADNPVTRSNDGRADPWGGFWIGTMGKQAEDKAGAIYRLYQDELRKLVSRVTISNAICFDRLRSCAYFTDTLTGLVMRQPLDGDTGWPVGAAEVFVDLKAVGLNPDGAVVDADGVVWIAQWGAARVSGYRPDGTFVRAISVPARHTTCPAFGGEDLRTMFVTSAREGLPEELLKAEPENGMTFEFANVAQGVVEPRVIL